jgi:ABC-type multidrug transport system fused ATPase/permease subunit
MQKTFRKVFDLLSPQERRRFVMLLGMVLVMGVFELAGVASILPFLAVLTKPEIIETNAILSQVRQMTGIMDDRPFMILLGFGVMVVIILSLIVKVITLYALARFSNMRRYTLSRRLMEGYLSHPYVWFLDKHSSDLARTINGEVNTVVGGTIIPLTQLISQGVVIFFLIVLLLRTDPVIALAAIGVMSTAYIAIFLLVRRRLGHIGKIRVAANRERSKATLEALGSLKDVKLQGLEDSYVKRFRAPALEAAQTATSSQIISELPRHLLEALAFGGILAMVLAMLMRTDSTLVDILPTLGLFAFAGLRMFPAMQAVYRALTTIRFNEATLDLVHSAIMEVEQGRTDRPQPPSEGPLPLKRRITLHDVTYSYPSTETPVLNGLNMTIAANTTVGIVGGTGAGKTTAIDVLLGLLLPQDGYLEIDDTLIDRSNVRRWQMSVGYVPQQIFLIDDSVAANIAFGVPPKKRDVARIETAARLARLDSFVMDLPKGYDTHVGDRGVRLSGGQRQRIAIARTLYHDPDVLIFDEATSALDNVTEREVMEAVNNLSHSKTIIMIAHRLSTVRNCDEIFLMEKGRIAAQGPYDKLLRDNASFRDMAGEET